MLNCLPFSQFKPKCQNYLIELCFFKMSKSIFKHQFSYFQFPYKGFPDKQKFKFSKIVWGVGQPRGVSQNVFVKISMFWGFSLITPLNFFGKVLKVFFVVLHHTSQKIWIVKNFWKSIFCSTVGNHTSWGHNKRNKVKKL